MWVFDSLDRCDSIDPPNAIGTIYADGACRAIEGVERSSPVYNLFPGYYTAVCTNEGKLLIENSGCVSDTCTSGTFGVCEANTSAPGHLFSRFAAPEYDVQSPTDADSAGFYTCYRLQGSDSNPVSVTFVIFGDCSQPSCRIHAAPVAATPITAPSPWAGNPWPVLAPFAPPPTAPFTLFPAPTLPPAPTPYPTQRPTRSPVTEPTTLEPTTEFPTFAPTAVPTVTQAPIPDVILTELEEISVGLRLSEMVGEMDDDDLAVWTSVTAGHIQASTPEILNATIENVVQEAETAVRRRGLQTAALQLRFDVIVEYIAGTAMNVETLFARAFDEEKDRIQYVRELVRRDAAAFESLNQISVLGLDNVAPTTVPTTTTTKEEKSLSGVLIGSITLATLSLVAGVCFVMILFARRRHNAGKAERLPPDTPDESSASQKKEEQKYTNEILVDTEADDVSTLGGSILNQANATVGDEPTASVNLDYDFEKKQYIVDSTDATTTAFSAVSKSLMAGESVFEDDDVSFEQQYADASNHVKRSFRPFEVQAPPGLLGMVVDTPSNTGIPVVRAIKPDSVLAGQIQIGDRLIAVDHQDVTKMSAMEVSNLISLKQNHARVLVFVRVV